MDFRPGSLQFPIRMAPAPRLVKPSLPPVTRNRYALGGKTFPDMTFQLLLRRGGPWVLDRTE